MGILRQNSTRSGKRTRISSHDGLAAPWRISGQSQAHREPHERDGNRGGVPEEGVYLKAYETVMNVVTGIGRLARSLQSREIATVPWASNASGSVFRCGLRGHWRAQPPPWRSGCSPAVAPSFRAGGWDT